MAGHGPSELWRNVQGYFITRRTAHPTKTNTLTISLFFLRKTTTTATLDKTEKDLLGPLLVRVFDLTNHLFICTTLCRLKNYFLSYYVSHICSYLLYRIGELAQMVERPLCTREVPGSIPGCSNWCPCLALTKHLFCKLQHLVISTKFSHCLTKPRSRPPSPQPNLLSQHLFFVSKGPKADSGGTFIQLNQPSSGESLG